MPDALFKLKQEIDRVKPENSISKPETFEKGAYKRFQQNKRALKADISGLVIPSL